MVVLLISFVSALYLTFGILGVTPWYARRHMDSFKRRYPNLSQKRHTLHIENNLAIALGVVAGVFWFIYLPAIWIKDRTLKDL